MDCCVENWGGDGELETSKNKLVCCQKLWHYVILFCFWFGVPNIGGICIFCWKLQFKREG
jgi:hypothetical protein